MVSSQGSGNGTVISVQEQEFVEDACFVKVTGKLPVSEMPTFIALYSWDRLMSPTMTVELAVPKEIYNIRGYSQVHLVGRLC